MALRSVTPVLQVLSPLPKANHRALIVLSVPSLVPLVRRNVLIVLRVPIITPLVLLCATNALPVLRNRNLDRLPVILVRSVKQILLRGNHHASTVGQDYMPITPAQINARHVHQVACSPYQDNRIVLIV